MQHTFTALGQDDCGEVLELATEIWNECYRDMITQGQIDYMLGRMYAPEQIVAELGKGVVWEFIESGNIRAGFMAFSLRDDAIALNKVYIRPEFRGAGLFGSAIQRIVAYGHSHGAGTIRLNVNKYNRRAIAAYGKNGFSIRSEVVVDIGEGYVMDDFIMVKEL